MVLQVLEALSLRPLVGVVDEIADEQLAHLPMYEFRSLHSDALNGGSTQF